MANTVVSGAGAITVVFDGSTAWDSATSFPAGLRVKSIQFVPAATDNVLTVRDGAASGVVLAKWKAATAYDWKNKEYDDGGFYRRHVYVVGNEATATAMLIIGLAVD